MQRYRNRLPVALVVVWIWTFLFPAATAADPEPRAPQPGESFRDCPDCPEMVVIPAGSFIMGSSVADTARDSELVPWLTAIVGTARSAMATEHPEHLVTIARPFAVGKYHITRAQFAAFVRETGYSTPQGECSVLVNNKYVKPAGIGWQNPGFTQVDEEPVVCVRWRDADAYVAWLNRKLRGSEAVTVEANRPYRLPSEAEWEYAARARTHTARWWGDAIGSGNAVCDGCGSKWDKKQTAPVGSFRPNPFGLHDMLGNARQWVADCWNKSYDGAPQDGSSWIASDCPHRVIRGGNWTNETWVLRSAARGWSNTTDAANYIGFRVAKTIP